MQITFWKKVEFTPSLEALLSQATKRSRYWITDAVENEWNGVGGDLDEAAYEFLTENGKESKYLVNAILAELGEPPIFK